MSEGKVFEVAKELNLSSEAMLRILRELGYDVKGHMSHVTQIMFDRIKDRMKDEKKAIQKEFIRKKDLKTASLNPSKKSGHRPEDAPAAPAAEEGVITEEDIELLRRGFKEGVEQVRYRKKKKSRKRQAQDKEVVKANIKATFASIETGGRGARKRYKKEEGDAQEEEATNKLKVPEFISVTELSQILGKSPSEVIAACLGLGLMVTINQRLDFEAIVMVCDEFGFEAELSEEYAEEAEVQEEKEEEKNLLSRAPVVTVMGHVDHGKTSLLDYIRKTNVIAGEAGGITQHIGAYEVETSRGRVTFLDTPGHEAFTAMRARGVRMTDVVVLVVAADSAVMPQTVEAIDHARAANVPILVALNKMDLPTANAEKIKKELTAHNILVEEWGGKTVAVEISCKTGKGVDKLLEMLALETDLLELKSNPNRQAQGVIVEAKLDRGKGPVATVLIQKGTLKTGDCFLAGNEWGRVRVMLDERGKPKQSAGPATPVQVLGLDGIPQAGDSFFVVEDEKIAREKSANRRQAQKEREFRKMGVTLDTLHTRIDEAKIQSLNLIVKGDVDGSVEALCGSLQQLSTNEIKINIIHKSVGAIKESDVLLGAASDAIVIGFHIRPNTKILELAQQEKVELRTYKIIYEAVDEIKKALAGKLTPLEKEEILGHAEVRALFTFSKLGTIAGCLIVKGKIKRSDRIRVIRDGVEVVESRIASLRHVKDDIREASEGQECGILLEGFKDLREGDVLEAFEIRRIERTL